MKNYQFKILLGLIFLFVSKGILAQGLDVTSCPEIDKRSNGNGQFAQAAGTFPTFFTNPVATNVVGTPYQTVSYLPSAKTGDVNFKWTSAITISKLPIITRVWLTARGATSATLSNIKFGPPPPPVIVGQRYYVNYNFYNQNMPAAGKVTLEFTDPVTNIPAFYCTFDLQQNVTSTPPTFDCNPIITQQPSNVNLACNDLTATFNVVASGIGTYQWQVSTNKGTSWSNLSNSSDYTGVSTASLTVSNPDSHDSSLYRAVLGNTNCASINSNSALLISKPLSNVTFSGSATDCGLANKTLTLNLTGTAPWTVIYSKTPSTGPVTNDTIRNIRTNPYFITVNPSVQTTYQLLSVSDNYCNKNVTTSPNTSIALNAIPTLSVINDTVCLNSSTFLFRYTSTGAANKYSISTGLRAMPGLSAIVDGNLTASPMNITIPSSGVPSGYYDFIISVKNSTTGCISEGKTLTLFVSSPITMSVSSNKSNFCAGESVTLTAAPQGLVSYTWVASNGSTIASVINPIVVVNASTTYTVTGTDANGCTFTSNITLNPNSNSSIVLTPSSSTICYGNSVVISASGGSNYTWSPSYGLSSSTGSNVIASPGHTTTYTVTSQNATGCNNISTITITVDSPSIAVTPSAILCLGSIKTLVATGGATYYWYPYTNLFTDAAATLPYTGTSVSTVYAKPTSSTTYYVVGTTAGNCSNVASSTITINQAPINLSTSTGGRQTSNSYIFCSKDVSTFDVQANFTAAVTSATWSYSTDSINYTSFSSAVSPTGATLTPSTSGASNRTLTISGFSNGGYAGPRYLRLTITYQSCTYNYDIKLFDTKGAGTTPVPVTTKSIICPGDSTSISLGAANGIYNLQWQSSTTLGGTYTNITGATSSVLNTGPLSATRYFKAIFEASGNVCDYTTDPIAISVTGAPAANTVNSNVSCTDGTTSIVLTGSTVTSAVYQWEYSITSSTTGFSNVLGAINKDYTLPVKAVRETTWYRRRATVGLCSDVLSTSVVLYAPITNNQITNSPANYCGNAAAVALTANTPSGGSGVYTYAWEESTTSETSGFSAIPSATNANYTTAISSVNKWYRRVVSTSGSCSSTSPAFLVPVNTKPTVSVPATQNICSGNAITLTATGGLNYVWKPSTGLSSTIGASVIANPLTTTTYTVVVTSANGCSDSATVLINVTTSPNAPVLSTGTKTICSNSGVFNLASLITSGTNVEWYTIPEVNSSFKLASSTVTTSGTYYAFSKNGSCYSTTYATLVLTIDDASTPSVNATSISLCSPQTANLTALQPSNRTGIQFKWYTTNDHNNSNIVNTPSSVGTGTYYLFAYSAAGNCYSSPATAVNVVVNSLVNATVSATTISACSPATVNLNLLNTTTGNNTYQWHTVSTNPTFTTLVVNASEINTSGTYYLYAINQAGCIGAASPGVVVTISNTPNASVGPVESFCGQNVRTIQATTNAVNPSYTWEVSSNDGASWTTVSNGVLYSGATTSTLSINNTTGLDAYLYRVNVQALGNTCIATSSTAILVEEKLPVIAIQPTNKITTIGGNTFLGVSLSNSPTASYQWKVSTNGGTSFNNVINSVNYSGVNSNPLIILNAPITFNGYLYKCEIYNYCDTVTTNTVSLFVTNSNIPPSAEDDSTTINEDGNATGNLGSNDSDPDGGPLSFSLVDSTNNGTVTVNSDGTYTYTPDPNFSGNDTLIYKVCDNGTPVKCDTAMLIITVNPVNDPPLAVDDNTTINEDGNATGNLGGNDSDPEGGPLSFSLVDSTNNGTITVNSDGSYTYTPDPNFSGNDTLIYKVCDNGTPVKCDTAILIITVNPVNDAPIAVDDNNTINQGGQATGNVGNNDTDPEGGALSFSTIDPVNNGTLILNSDGSYTYTPNPSFSGKDTLVYKVCDNGTPVKCDTAILVITVNPVNNAPIAVDDNNTINQGGQATGNVGNNDTDPEGGALSFSTIDPVNNGTLILNSDGSYTYTPDPSFSGKDTLVYKVCDNGTPVKCDTAILIITVNSTTVIVPKIGLAKSVAEPTILTDETFELTYVITVKNYGNVDLKNIRVEEDLTKSFPTPTEFNVIQLSAESGLTINPAFDGVNNKELLDSLNSTIVIGETKTITLKLFLKPNQLNVVYSNIVIGYGTSTIGGLHASDSSVEGTDPDPNADGNPNETSGTLVKLEIFIPSGFSPDGDGKNDAFVIKGIENYPNNTLSIFNRWGNLIYEKSPYDNTWKGNTENAAGVVLGDGLLPNGTYFYLLNFGVPEIKSRTGYIVIKK